MTGHAYNRRAIFKRAHFSASWRQAGGDKRQYRAIFAECLRAAWAQHRRCIAARNSAVVREQLRSEQNLGLPIATYAYDLSVMRRGYVAGRRSIAAMGE